MNRKGRIRLFIAVFVLFILPLISYLFLTKGAELQKHKRVPPFSLTDQSGQTFDSQMLDKKVWVASFIFTRCDQCENQIQAFENLQQKYADNADVELVMITIDPENDSLPVLMNFAYSWKIDPEKWHLLRGEKKNIYNLILGGFCGKVNYGEGNPEIMEADDKIVLINKEGFIRGYFPVEDADDLARLTKAIENQLLETPN